jgi:L-ornithine N5-oxygenase
MTATALDFDLLGIGFGPANLALAVAMEDSPEKPAIPTYGFIEKKREFVWHGGMLLDDSFMQISFLKDLVTLRDPKSRFTFVNYLHCKQRLEEFINLKTFYPTRLEYNDYLRWVASHFDDHCHYGEEVFAVEPLESGGKVRGLRVRSRDADGAVVERRCRNLVIGIGGVPNIPSEFARHGSSRVLHSSTYLDRIDAVVQASGAAPRIAVIGSGQSGAEVFCDLAKRFAHVEVTMISRGNALKPADDSPFVNEIFSPRFTDVVYSQPDERRRALLEEFRNTNYAVADSDLISKIYDMLYQQKVAELQKHEVLFSTHIEQVCAAADRIGITTRNAVNGTVLSKAFDVIILATGYSRNGHRDLLAGVRDYIDNFAVDRQYRLATKDNFLPGIYLQGCCEDTHGLSDTLLSVLSIRSREIADAVAPCIAGPCSRFPMPQSVPSAPAPERGAEVSAAEPVLKARFLY